MKLKHICIALFCVILQTKTHASHIVNGNLSAYILKDEGDSLKYNISLTFNSTCEPNSIVAPDQFLVCAFNANSGQLFKSQIVKLFQSVKQSNCLGICVNKTTYTGTIVVPKTSMYVFQTQICCRRTLNTLRNDQSGMPFIGQTFYCKISGDINDGKPIIDFPSYINLNPDIIDSIDYTIITPSNDSFVIVKTTPFYGASIANNYPSCSSTPNNATINLSDYASGFSPSFPLGSNGIWKINTDQSSVVFKCSGAGEYVTAYKLSFFRNGRLYYETVREIEVFVSNYKLNNQNQIDLKAKAFPTPFAEIQANICPLNVEKLQIERSDFTNQNFTPLAPLNSSNFIYEDYTVNHGKEYFYRIKVYKTNDTFYSDTVKVTFFNKSIHDVVLDDLKIAPNPSNQFFDISWQMANIVGIEVVSSNGQTILKHPIQEEKSYRLDASEFESGVYVVKFIDQQGKAYYKRLVKID